MQCLARLPVEPRAPIAPDGRESDFLKELKIGSLTDEKAILLWSSGNELVQFVSVE